MESLHRISKSDLERFLETPEELLRESEEIQIAVATFSETPRSLLEVLTNSDCSTVVEVARLHVNWVDEERGDFREAVSEVLLDKDLGENDRLAVELMRFAPVAPEFLSEWVPFRCLIQGLKNEYMPLRYRLKLLERLSEKGEIEGRLKVAESSETPVSILEQLARDSDETICQTVATNPSLPFNSLLELARNSSARVKLNIAYKSSYGNTPATPRELLEILAEDESEQVRAKVAEHPDTPVDILVRLANDSSRDVKSKLTANLNTPVEVLTRLGLEENLVNQRNPNTPRIALAQAVRNMKSKALADFLKHPVQGSQMPSSTLAQLATNTNSSVRYRVACHPNTTATVLRQLARDSYIATIRAVASNHNTFPETLEVLSTNPDFTTRHSVVNNPNVPPRVLAQIVMSSCVSGNQPNQTVDMLKSAFPGNNNDVCSLNVDNIVKYT
ncbi:MAG: hypothetical protein AAFQ91_07185 [Cyanobacteria bacterium J06621_15]